MANTKKTATPNKSGARCCSSKKSDNVKSCGTNKTASKNRTQNKNTETVK